MVNIGGKGACRAELAKLCQELALGDKVIFPGFIADADLPQLLNSVDIFAMPSHAELQSIATLEAMAEVVCRSWLPMPAPLPELVTPAINGALFAPRDPSAAVAAMERLLQQRTRWQEMGTASRTKAECHAHERVVTHYVQWYRNYGGRPFSVPERTPIAVDSVVA
ncbi:MAG: glycosyltransferase [Caldilineaceae bacterium]